jgi:hypothetical protein
MEVSIDTLIALLGLFIGGGGGAFFTWRWQRKKAKAEAKTAEADAAKELQDVYQQLINDVKTDREEQKTYIGELKEDRAHLRRDRDDLRKRQDELEESIRNLQREVARNTRIVDFMRPLLCGREGCAIRVPVTVSDVGVVKPEAEEPKDIEPLNMKDL